MTLASGQRARARSRPPDGRTRRARRRGQALVELAIILPVFLILLLGALDLGRVFYATITVENAAKEAALNMSDPPNGGADPVAAAINEARGGFVTIAAADVATSGSCSDTSSFGDLVEATVSAQFESITPYIAAFLGGQTITLTSVATAYCAVLPPGSTSPTPTPTPGPTPTPTPDPGPTPTPTPDPGPTPTPTPTPSPTPTPTPTPVCKVVPNMVGMTVANARTAWTGAGFTGSFSPTNGQNNKTVNTQSQTAGACLPVTTTVSVTYS